MTFLMPAAVAIITGLVASLLGGVAPQTSGTEYSGAHSGGGAIQFAVSPNGSRITSLTLTGVSGEGCSWETLGIDIWGGRIEIRENAFSATSSDGDTIAGSFPSPFHAEGTLQIVDPASGCSSGLLHWTATSPEPVRAAPPLGPSAAQPTPLPPGIRPAPALGARDAPYCAVGQRPSFHEGLFALKLRLGDPMGVVLECEHLNNANGDTLQQTTTGLAYFRWATGLPTFTDGWRHWALSGDDMIVWEGESPDPPVAR